MGRRHAALTGLAALALAACGAPGPALRTYSLASASLSRAPLRSEHPLPGVLTVLRFSADSVLTSRRIAWRSSPTALIVGNYSDHLWSSAPPETMQTEIAHCLREAGAAEAVAPDSTPIEADWILSGRLTYFEQQLTGPEEAPGNAQARLAADLVLTRTRGSRQPVWQETLDIAVPLADSRPEHVAGGIREALSAMCKRLVKSLSAAWPSRSGFPRRPDTPTTASPDN
jgi:ABC-type uncharacterized transport system auxiliary subunit